MDKRKLRFMVISSILLIISVTTALFYKVHAQKGPILREGEIKGFYLDTESIESEKDNERGTRAYTECWYSMDPEIFHEKSGIDSKTGKLKKVDCYYIDICVITCKNRKLANDYIERYLKHFTVVGRGRWKEGSYLGNVYGERTICFKVKNKIPQRNKSVKFLIGRKVVEIHTGGEVKGKYTPVEFIENIARVVERRVK